MKKEINRFIHRNYHACIIGSFVAAISGIVLAYLTNDADPWGTIGGFVCGLSLIFVLHTVTTRNR